MDLKRLSEEIVESLDRGDDKIKEGLSCAFASDSELNILYRNVSCANKAAEVIREAFPVYAIVAESFSGSATVVIFPKEESDADDRSKSVGDILRPGAAG